MVRMKNFYTLSSIVKIKCSKQIVDFRNGELIDWLWFSCFRCNVSLNSINQNNFFKNRVQ